MLNLSKESGRLFEKIYYQRTIMQLNKKLYGLRKHRVQLIAMLSKERRAKLMEELYGLERLTERLVSRVKPADYRFVKVQVGGNQVLLSQAVLVRRKRVNKNSVYRTFVKGRMTRIINRLHLLQSNWDTYYRSVHTDARNTIMGMFMTLNKKYSIYLSSCVATSRVKVPLTPITRNSHDVNQGRQQRISTVQSEKKIEPLLKSHEKTKSQEKNRDVKVIKKVEAKKAIEKPKKTTMIKESISKSPEKKPVAKTQIRSATNQGTETITVSPKAAPEKTMNKRVNQETKNLKTKKPQGKLPMKKQYKNPSALEELNEEIYLDSLMGDSLNGESLIRDSLLGDLESSNVETRNNRRSKYMDEMVLK